MKLSSVRFILLSAYAAYFSLAAILFFAINEPDELPSLPLYPGARQVIETVETPQGADKPTSITVTFLTSDKPTEVEQYYVSLLRNDGWEYNDCRQFSRAIHFAFGGDKYVRAGIHAEPLEDGQTQVSSSVSFGWLSCDKV